MASVTLSVIPSLGRNRSCDLCALSNGPRNPCIPTTLLPYSQQGHDQAVLFCGTAPSYFEDLQDCNFVGPAGTRLDSFYVHGSGIQDYADLYGTNAVRCRPPQDASPTVSQIQACSRYLQSDIAILSAKYRRVAIVALGNIALRAVLDTGRSVADQASLQAQRITPEITPKSPLLESAKSGNVYLFGTYNPAYLDVDPSAESRVISVMEALYEWLVTGTITYETMPPIEIAPVLPAGFSGPVAFDTETHACLIGSPMNSFHPRKAAIIDGVPRDSLIVCSSIAWRDADGILHLGYFDWRDRIIHISRFLEWLTAADEIWGQNLQYDLKMVRYVLGRNAVPTWRPVRDLLVETFLYDDLQERDLKTTAFLYRIASYAEDRKAVRAYNGPDDPQLSIYACKDAWTTYRGIEIARQWQAEKFSEHPIARSKLSPDRDRWYSDQVWSALLMEEDGCAISVKALDELDKTTRAALAAILAEAESLGLIISGPGKMESARALILEAAACAVSETARLYGTDSPQHRKALETTGALSLTDKQAVSIGTDNRNQLLGILPLASDNAALYARKLSLFSEAQSLGKILSSYTGVLLRGKKIAETYPMRPVIVNRKAKHWAHEINPRTGKPYVTGRRIKYVPDKSRPIPQYRRTDAVMRIKERPHIGIAYPSIFILPKAADDTGPSGGTKQFRWSFKAPALQTLPEKVFGCLTSRFPGGRVLKYDLKAIEWRMAGYRSNDPVILSEIANGIDMHERTASELLEMNIGDPDVLRKWIQSNRGRTILCAAPDAETRLAARHAFETATELTDRFLQTVYRWARNKVGKSPNFAWAYGGQDPVIIATCRVKGGVEIPPGIARAWWLGMQSRYTVYAEYREAHVAAACRDLAVHLPILGQSRSFSGTPDEIRRIYGEEITSPPIQTPSACLMQSAITELQRHFTFHNMKSIVCLNIHDALVVDVHPNEIPGMPALVEHHLRNNWYLSRLQEYHNNRPFPLDFEGDWL